MLSLFTKNNDYGKQAAALASMIFPDVRIFLGLYAPFPEEAGYLLSGTVISYLSPWIIPQYILNKSDCAINFHPGSANYPGIGCYNFALYEEAKAYGCTCHFMEPTVDTGAIIEQRIFPVLDNDTVESLQKRTMVSMLSMFHDVLCSIYSEKQLHVSGDKWSRRPFTRKQLNELAKINQDMDKAEIAKRVRATTYKQYRPYLELDDSLYTITQIC